MVEGQEEGAGNSNNSQQRCRWRLRSWSWYVGWRKLQEYIDSTTYDPEVGYSLGEEPQGRNQHFGSGTAFDGMENPIEVDDEDDFYGFDMEIEDEDDANEAEQDEEELMID